MQTGSASFVLKVKTQGFYRPIVILQTAKGLKIFDRNIHIFMLYCVIERVSNKVGIKRMWDRNMYTGPGGGAYTGPGGGMYTGPGGGAYTGPGGGLYTGPGGGAYTGPGGGLYTGPGGGAYNGPGGGAYTGPGGGLYNGPGGGLYTGPGGGMYTGPDSNPYRAIHPPWPIFAMELRKIGMANEANLIEDALSSIGWRG